MLDAGIATEANIKWLKYNQYYYLVVSRKKKKDSPENINMITAKEDDNTLVQAGLVNREDNPELELYCYSKGKEKKEKEMDYPAASCRVSILK